MKRTKHAFAIASLLLGLFLPFQARAGGHTGIAGPIKGADAAQASAEDSGFRLSTGITGWLFSSQMSDGDDASGAVENAGRRTPFMAFAQANTTRTTITCRDATLYTQYSPKKGPLDPRGVLQNGERVGWRQNYNGSWAIVLYYRTAQWGFVMRRCLGYAG